MSRMGQCFTQAQEAVIIPYAENSPLVRIEQDVTSNAKDPNGEPYVFSDGIGCLSEALARKVLNGSIFHYYCNDMMFQFIPGCRTTAPGSTRAVGVSNPLRWLQGHVVD